MIQLKIFQDATSGGYSGTAPRTRGATPAASPSGPRSPAEAATRQPSRLLTA